MPSMVVDTRSVAMLFTTGSQAYDPRLTRFTCDSSDRCSSMLATCPFAERFRPSPTDDTTTTSSIRLDEVAVESVNDNIDNNNVDIICI